MPALSSSGGIQEEAPALGKPVLVLRDTTERPEAIEAGTAKQVVYQETKLLLSDRNEYDKLANACNPYGDGKASQRIVQTILWKYGVGGKLPQDYSCIV